MRDFVSRTLSLFVGLVMFAVFTTAVLYYTTPAWMRQMTGDAMKTMEQMYGQQAPAPTGPPVDLNRARAFCLRAYPEQPWEKRAFELDDRGRGRSAHPEIAWAEYDRIFAARTECVQSFR